MFGKDTDIDRLIPNEDTAFQMEQIMNQPDDPRYPPVLHTYSFKEVYRLVDQGEDVKEYIDRKALTAMQRTLAQFPKNHKHKGHLLDYQRILKEWL